MTDMTLLDMTQNILSAMKSDNVNDISDTPESVAVTGYIKETYELMMVDRDWPHLRHMTTLTGLGDVTNPTKMQLPENVSDMAWVKYDKRASAGDPRTMKEITYLEPQDFINRLDLRNDSDSNITVVTDGGVKFNVYNDRAPEFWTSFDNEYIMFDAHDNTLDSTLQTSKSSIYATVEPSWTNSNSFVPDLPSHMFPMLLSEAKSVSMLNLKQTPAPKEEQRSRRMRNRMQSKSFRQNGKNKGVDYGRR